MNRLVMIVLSLIMLSGCSSLTEYLREYYKEPMLAGPADTSKMEGCDEACQEQWKKDREEVFKTQSWRYYNRQPQSYDTYEYQVQINGKTVTCRPGINRGSLDGINHNVECK